MWKTFYRICGKNEVKKVYVYKMLNVHSVDFICLFQIIRAIGFNTGYVWFIGVLNDLDKMSMSKNFGIPGLCKVIKR